MKILLITIEYPPFKGGVGNYYHHLVSQFKGYDLEVLTDYPGRYYEKMTYENVQITRRSFFYQSVWPAWLKLFFSVRRLVSQQKFDLLWVGQVLPIGTVAYLMKKIFKLRYFVSTHGMDILLPQTSFKKIRLMKKILSQAEFITANSQYTKSELIKLGIPAEKIEIIYPCPNIGGYQLNMDRQLKIRQKLGLENKKIILTVGRLVERKGQDQIIKALPEILKQVPSAVYLIIGSGPYQLKLEESIKQYHLEDKVKILIDVSDDDLPYYYELADVFAMPARSLANDVEGFGMVYLEAGLFGKPVIASTEGGTKETFINNQTGLTVDPINPADIAAKIIILLSDFKLYQQLAIAAKNFVKQNFNWSVEAAKLAKRINNYERK